MVTNDQRIELEGEKITDIDFISFYVGNGYVNSPDEALTFYKNSDFDVIKTRNKKIKEIQLKKDLEQSYIKSQMLPEILNKKAKNKEENDKLNQKDDNVYKLTKKRLTK